MSLVFHERRELAVRLRSVPHLPTQAESTDLARPNIRRQQEGQRHPPERARRDRERLLLERRDVADQRFARAQWIQARVSFGSNTSGTPLVLCRSTLTRSRL